MHAYWKLRRAAAVGAGCEPGDEVIAFRREHASPLEVGERAPAVDPPTLQRWIAQGHDDAGKRLSNYFRAKRGRPPLA